MGRPLDQLMGLPVEEMTDEEIERAIRFHRGQLLGPIGTPNIYVRLADLERVVKDRKLDSVVQGWSVVITIYDPHMKPKEREMVSYICSTTAEKRFKQASDALNDRNWLVMNDESIKGSFEEITESAFSPTPEDLERIHSSLEKAIDAGGVLDHVKEVRDLIIDGYIDKYYKRKIAYPPSEVIP